MQSIGILGIDQYGMAYHDLGKYPRKALLEKIGASKASKMYVDRNGESIHVGYVIRRLWVTLYHVGEWSR